MAVNNSLANTKQAHPGQPEKNRNYNIFKQHGGGCKH